MTVCEIFLNGWRSSQTIWRTQKCMIQIRNVQKKVASSRSSIHIHFPKDRNCEVCLRTKMTSALCRRRTGEALPRAEKFGDLITADHKVLYEEGESRNSHPYAVVVEDLVTQWVQSYPCKTKISQETEKSSRDNSLEFGQYCEDVSWKLRTSTPHRSETSGIASRPAV